VLVAQVAALLQCLVDDTLEFDGNLGVKPNRRDGVLVKDFVENSTSVWGGAMYIEGGTITIGNSLFSHNIAGKSESDCDNQLKLGTISASHNLSSAGCGKTAATGIATLASNGGLTQTVALASDSNAIDAASECPISGTDQRGTARPQGKGCDIGAYEHQVPLPVFSGFLSPVKAGIVNQLNAGRVLPVNFKLGGDFGLTPFVTGYPMVTVTSCPASSVARYNIPSSSTTTGVKASKLNYNALTGQYTYLWVTEKNWEGSCRRLTFRFTGENVAYSLDVEFVR